MMNPELKNTIWVLKAASRKEGKAIWRALADALDKPRRRRVAVNLSQINRYTEAGNIVAIPGKVLAAGSIRHPVTVAAFSFSEAAKKKIANAEGRTMSLTELVEEGIEPSEVKILK